MAAKKPKVGVIEAGVEAAKNLAAIDARFALIGGLGVGARAEPRFTRDVDLIVAVADDEEAERVVHQLASRGYRVATVLEHRLGRLATARLLPPSSAHVYIDLLFASSGIEGEIVEAAEALRVSPDARLPVARVGHLIALKVLSERPTRLQDRIDLRALASVATPDDWRLAEDAARLIRKRGFHRGRALVTRTRQWRHRATL